MIIRKDIKEDLPQVLDLINELANMKKLWIKLLIQ